MKTIDFITTIYISKDNKVVEPFFEHFELMSTGMCSKKSLGSQVVCIAFGPRYVILRNVQGIEVVEGIDDGIEGLLAGVSISETLLYFFFDDGERVITDGKQLAVDKLMNVVRNIGEGCL